jgi:hypothetical protein
VHEVRVVSEVTCAPVHDTCKKERMVASVQRGAWVVCLSGLVHGSAPFLVGATAISD